jgi:hypothetical protein
MELNLDTILFSNHNTNSRGPLWIVEDGAYSTWGSSCDLPGAIGEVVASSGMDDSLSCSSEGPKRKQPEFVMALPADPQHKRGWHAAPPPVAD